MVAQGDLRPMAGNDEAMEDLKRILDAREPNVRQGGRGGGYLWRNRRAELRETKTFVIGLKPGRRDNVEAVAIKEKEAVAVGRVD